MSADSPFTLLHTTCLLAVLLPTLCIADSASSQPAASATPSPLQQCTTLLLQTTNQAESQLPEIIKAADTVANRWIAGAELYIGGDSGFAEEAFYRAGGLIALRRIASSRQTFGGNGRTVPWSGVPKGAIILYGLHRNVDPGIITFDELGQLTSNKHTVILFASQDWPITRKMLSYLRDHLPADRLFFIDTHLPVDTRLTAGPIRFGDYAPMATAVYTWTFTSELIASCTRQGKMPGVWPSAMIPHYEVWEKRYEKIRFHDDLAVKPIEAGILAGEYLRILRHQLHACPAETPSIQEAASLLAAIPASKTVYVLIESHLLAADTWLPVELPNWLLVQRGWRWPRAAETADKGDAVLWLGYLRWPADEAAQAARHEMPLVGISARAPGRQVADEPLVTPGQTTGEHAGALVRDAFKGLSLHSPAPASGPSSLPAGTAWVRAPWQYPDSVIDIPGYPIKACPTSSIIQGTIFWGLLGQVIETDRAHESP